MDEPLMTINALVKVGPWTIGPVHYGEWRQCDRCGTHHKYVWVCTIDSEVDDAMVAARLQGRRVWRVGSKCGPTLEMVSDSKWGGPPKELARIVKLAVDAKRAIAGAQASDLEFWALPLVVERLELLLKGGLSRHLQRVLRHHVSGILDTLRADAAKAVRASAASAGLPLRPGVLGISK